MEKRMIIGKDEAGKRLDAVLAVGLELSRSKVKKAMEAGLCRVDGQICRDGKVKVKGGEEVLCLCPEEHVLEAQPGNDDALRVYFRTENFVVLEKGPGVVVHPGVGEEQGTLVHRMLAEFPQLAEMGGKRPGVVHRLDKDTSGLLLLALNESTRLQLTEDFAGRRVHKRYLALLRGVVKERGEICAPIGRHPTLKTRQAVRPDGKEARTEWQRLYADPAGKFCLVEVMLHTGRTHQIRVHMAHMGPPLWGDKVYGQADSIPRQMLHAWKLAFADPAGGERLAFCKEPPADFLESALFLAKRCCKVVITGAAGGGKSTLLALLAKAGLPVWSADAQVAQLYEKGGDGWHFLQGRYGERFACEGGVDKQALAAAMEREPHLRKEVEEMIHPMVFAAMRMFFDAHADKDWAVAEIPLYWESGQKFDAVTVGLYCGREKRWQRLMEHRGWSAQRCAFVDSLQWPEEKKAAACAVRVENTADVPHLEKEVAALLDKLNKLREEEHLRLKAMFQHLWRCEQGSVL